MAVSELVDGLAQILERHCAAYANLCTLLESQREAIKDNDLAELRSLLITQERMLMSIAADEARREEVQEELVRHLDISQHDISLQELVEAEGISPFYRRRLNAARIEAVQLMDRVKVLNEENRNLIQVALKFVAYSLDGIRIMGQSGLTYGDDRHDAGDVDPVLMDRKS